MYFFHLIQSCDAATWYVIDVGDVKSPSTSPAFERSWLQKDITELGTQSNHVANVTKLTTVTRLTSVTKVTEANTAQGCTNPGRQVDAATKFFGS